jgi:hypothetical protein
MAENANAPQVMCPHFSGHSLSVVFQVCSEPSGAR